MRAFFRVTDIDDKPGPFEYSFFDVALMIEDWNTDMLTEYETIQDFNNNEEYYKIELKIFTND